MLRDAARAAERRCAPATHPDAGGLVVAIDKEHAERLADRLARITGERPDDRAPPTPPDASAADRALRGRLRRLARVGADGLRGRRRPAAARRRLRDDARAPSCSSARSSAASSAARRRRSEQMSHLFLPSDPRAEAARGADRGGAQPRARARRPRARRWPSAASAPRRGEAFRALWSSARRDDDVLQTTQPGEALQLFAEPAPPAPSPAFAAFTTTAAASRRPRTSAASGCATSAARSSPRSRAAPARRTARSTRASTATIGAASVDEVDASSSSSGQPRCSSERSADRAPGSAGERQLLAG